MIKKREIWAYFLNSNSPACRKLSNRNGQRLLAAKLHLIWKAITICDTLIQLIF
jgi:hypothetical protein